LAHKRPRRLTCAELRRGVAGAPMALSRLNRVTARVERIGA
jgi:hypothetical protein